MLHVRDVRRVFPGRHGAAPVRALDDVSLHVERGELFALLGPSGCGKTTLLQSIAGLETPDGGSIAIDGRPVFDAAGGTLVPANRRHVGMVFQSYAIWPHMTVFANVAFPLLYGGGGGRPARAEVRRRVMEALELVKLADLAERPAPHLSGGQQQRVALARAVVNRPRLLLLDEPLSNLDAKLRDAMRVELRQMIKALGITAVFVTHDQAEAMGMADRLALMRGGRIIGLGSPDDVYFRPATVFAAEFMGQGNVLRGRVAERNGRRVLATAAGDLALADPDAALGEDMTAVARPHAVEIVDEAPAAATDILRGTVERQSLLGSHREVEVRIGNALLRVHVDSFRHLEPGTAVTLRLRPERCLFLRDAAQPRPAAA